MSKSVFSQEIRKVLSGSLVSIAKGLLSQCVVWTIGQRTKILKKKDLRSFQKTVLRRYTSLAVGSSQSSFSTSLPLLLRPETRSETNGLKRYIYICRMWSELEVRVRAEKRSRKEGT